MKQFSPQNQFWTLTTKTNEEKKGTSIAVIAVIVVIIIIVVFIILGIVWKLKHPKEIEETTIAETLISTDDPTAVNDSN